MKWTKEKPTAEGWYWFRFANPKGETLLTPHTMVHVSVSFSPHYQKIMHIHARWAHDEYQYEHDLLQEHPYDGEFYGPLEVPE